MTRLLQHIPQAVGALIVAAALSFGVTEALARAPALACPDDGFNFLGPCNSPDNCDLRCVGIGGFQGQCYMSGGENCCACLH